MKIQEIFEEVGYFGSLKRSDWFEPEVVMMGKNSFILKDFFYQSTVVKLQLVKLLQYYLGHYSRSASEIRQSELVNAVLKFSERFSLEDILDKIEAGEVAFHLEIPLDNSIFELRRAGNSLAFRVFSGNGRNDIHKTGTALIEAACGTKINAQAFIKRIVFTVPVARYCGPDNSVIIDLRETITEITNFCSGVAWGEDYTKIGTKLIERYTNRRIGKVYAGEIAGVKRWLRLVHLNYDNSVDEKSQQYRRGNFFKVEGKVQTWRFDDGGGLFLQIGIDCDMKDVFLNSRVPLNTETSKRQYILRKWAAAMHGQLYARAVVQKLKV